MKKAYVLLWLCCGGYFLANGQDLRLREVPSVVLNSFQMKYPNAKDMEWEFKQGYYEVEFEMDKREFEITYDEKGQICYYEEELTANQLPIGIREYIARQYPGYRMSEVKKKDKGKVTYKVELKKNMAVEHEVLFSAGGDVLEDKLD